MYHMNKSGAMIIGGVIGLTLLFVLGIFLSDTEEKTIQTDASLRVAFIGDQGTGPSAFEVLNLIKDEEANLVLHQGDFDYQSVSIENLVENKKISWNKDHTTEISVGIEYIYLSMQQTQTHEQPYRFNP